MTRLRRTRSLMRKGVSAGIGAAATYFFDPEHGHHRRQQLKEAAETRWNRRGHHQSGPTGASASAAEGDASTPSATIRTITPVPSPPASSGPATAMQSRPTTSAGPYPLDFASGARVTTVTLFGPPTL